VDSHLVPTLFTPERQTSAEGRFVKGTVYQACIQSHISWEIAFSG